MIGFRTAGDDPTLIPSRLKASLRVTDFMSEFLTPAIGPLGRRFANP